MKTVSVSCSTGPGSGPSIAITKPRVRNRGGEEGEGGGKGGEIWVMRRILFRAGIDITIASSDLAWAEAGESSVVGDMDWGGFRVRGPIDEVDVEVALPPGWCC